MPYRTFKAEEVRTARELIEHIRAKQTFRGPALRVRMYDERLHQVVFIDGASPLSKENAYHVGVESSIYAGAALRFAAQQHGSTTVAGRLTGEYEALNHDYPELFTAQNCQQLIEFCSARPGDVSFDVFILRTVIACLKQCLDAGKERAGADYHSMSLSQSEFQFISQAGERLIAFAKVEVYRGPVLMFGGLPVIQDLGSFRLWKKQGERVRTKYLVYTDLTPQLNQFEMDYSQLLGVGSYGSVFKMKYKGMQVAVKQMKEIDMDVLAREVTVQTMTSHPNLLSLIGVFSAGRPEYPHLVSEFADFGDLLTYLTRNRGTLTEKLKLSFAINICNGLAFLHTLGIVHRDLKSENILVFKGNVCKIADFGLCRTTSSAFSKTQVAGSFLYQAPELVLAQKKASGGLKVAEAAIEPSSDIYSLGYILWEIAMEQRVYSDQAQLEVMQSKMKDATAPTMFQKLVSRSKDTPLPLPESRWDAQIKSCWAYKPDHRPAAIALESSLREIDQQL